MTLAKKQICRAFGAQAKAVTHKSAACRAKAKAKENGDTIRIDLIAHGKPRTNVDKN